MRILRLIEAHVRVTLVVTALEAVGRLHAAEVVERLALAIVGHPVGALALLAMRLPAVASLERGHWRE